jgi:tetratricopeptide (TPR) repeat protein
MAFDLKNLTPEQVRDIADGKLLLMEVLGVSPAEMLQHFDKAMNFIAIGKLDDAVKVLKGLAALDVRNPAFPSALGSVELMRKNYSGAVDHSQKAVQLDAKFVTAYYVLGEALAQLKRNDEATAALEKAFELKPDDNGRDALRCRSIYTGLTGKTVAPAPVPGGVPAPAPGAPAAVPGAAAPQAAPRPAPAAAPVARAVAPTPVGRGTIHGGAFSRPAPQATMLSRTGAVPATMVGRAAAAIPRPAAGAPQRVGAPPLRA